MTDVRVSAVEASGAAHDLRAKDGEQLMALLRDQVDIGIGVCGGVISCGTCLVKIGEAWQAKLPEPSQDETEMLEALDAEPGSRLGCQVFLNAALDGLSLTIAPPV